MNRELPRAQRHKNMVEVSIPTNDKALSRGVLLDPNEARELCQQIRKAASEAENDE